MVVMKSVLYQFQVVLVFLKNTVVLKNASNRVTDSVDG